jgi:signal transduction histidine kinase
MIIALFMGGFVLLKSRSLLGYILCGISMSFALWVVADLMTWLSVDSSQIMFWWSVFNIFSSMYQILGLYFIYVFVDGKDAHVRSKIVWGALLLPLIVFMSSEWSLVNFNAVNCEASEGVYYNAYAFILTAVISLWVVALLTNRYFRAAGDNRKKIAILGMSVFIYIVSDFVAGILVWLGYITYEIQMYGLFGILFFIVTLAYLIVQYGAMDIKLARAQALVWSLIFLIGAQFFFIGNPTNRVLNSIAFVLVCIIGYGVVKSVKREEMQKDRLMKFSKDLARANAELKRLDNAKSEFISIASHQLRTPLTAIKGYISLILEGAYGENTDKTDDALNKIFLANERLIQLVEDMLNLTRIESGRLEYRLEDDVHVEDILNELKDMFILRAQDKKLELEIQTPDGQLPAIKADKSKLREVISNLMDNAIKYTKEGFVHVIAEKDGEVVRVTIKDSGMGISEESLKTLFAKFSRGTDSTKVYTDGSGLGLYVGKNLIESQGGHIYAKSDGVDKGSEFIIEMPIAKGN